MDSFVTEHPGAVTVLLSTSIAVLGVLLKLLLRAMERRIDEKFASITVGESEQNVRLDKIESDLRGFDSHVAVGTRESLEIHAAIVRVENSLASHVLKEEGTTWAKIDDLVTAVNEMRLENELSHADLKIHGATLETRVKAIEAKMPNGELKQLADAYTKLALRP